MKTEDDVRTLLRDVAQTYDATPPPTPLLIGRGRRARKQRLGWMAGGATAIVIAVVTVGGLLARPSDDPRTVTPVDTTPSAATTDEAPTIEPSVVVPAMLGFSQAEAVEVLEAVGLEVVVSTVPSDCPDADSAVTGQAPSAGREVRTGSKIYLNVGVAVCGVSADDARVVERFEAFARDPSGGGPFASSVAIGLGNEYRKSIDAADQAARSQWRLDLIGYAERSGTLSVLDLVAANTDIRTLTADVSPSFCPSTLVDRPQPELTRGGHVVRVGIQEPPGSCSQLATVDLYINDAEEIVGVNVGLGAP